MTCTMICATYITRYCHRLHIAPERSAVWCVLCYWRVRLLTSIMNNAAHYSDVIMSAMTSQITSLTIVYSTVYSGADQRKHQSSASLAFVRGIHRWPVNSPHKGPVTRKLFPFDDVIMIITIWNLNLNLKFGDDCPYEITYPFPNLNCCIVESWEWINNLIARLTEHVITHPCWD